MSKLTSRRRILRQFGTIVKNTRQNIGLSQEKFALQAGFHRTYIGAVERGERNLTLTNMVKLAEALQVSLYDILSQVEEV